MEPPSARTRRDVLTLISAADIVKVSDEDLAWIDPGHDPERVVADWLRQGPVVVIVTRGAQGAAAMTAAGRVEIAALTVEIADTVGAGDTLVGAFLSALVGIAWAGADPPWPDEIRAPLPATSTPAQLPPGRRSR